MRYSNKFSIPGESAIKQEVSTKHSKNKVDVDDDNEDNENNTRQTTQTLIIPQDHWNHFSFMVNDNIGDKLEEISNYGTTV